MSNKKAVSTAEIKKFIKQLETLRLNSERFKDYQEKRFYDGAIFACLQLLEFGVKKEVKE